MKLNIHQLMLLRGMMPQGWPPDLVHIHVVRCGATQEEWEELLREELIGPDENGRLWMTKQGKKEYEKQRQGQYF